MHKASLKSWIKTKQLVLIASRPALFAKRAGRVFWQVKNKRVENINLATIMISGVTLLGIFILNLIVGMYYGFGVRHYWFFQTLHFLGGFFVAMFFSGFLQSTTAILIGLGIVTLLWESTEFIISSVTTFSRYIKNKFHLKNVDFKWSDSLFDIALNFSGAFVFLYLL